MSFLHRSRPGCNALLSSDLAQMLWLPLSDVKQANNEWLPVFRLSLQLAAGLLSAGGQLAVENSVNVVALLQEQLTTFLLAPKISVEPAHIDIMVTAAGFVAMFMAYHKQVGMQFSLALFNLVGWKIEVHLLIHPCAALNQQLGYFAVIIFLPPSPALSLQCQG